MYLGQSVHSLGSGASWTRRQLCPTGSRPPRMYGLPKIHKEGILSRPIVSNIGTPTYQLSKHLSGLLNQLTGKSAHYVKNSFHFIEILETLKIKPGDQMVSFDMVSLFTKVQLKNHSYCSINTSIRRSCHCTNMC